MQREPRGLEEATKERSRRNPKQRKKRPNATDDGNSANSTIRVRGRNQTRLSEMVVIVLGKSTKHVMTGATMEAFKGVVVVNCLAPAGLEFLPRSGVDY